MERLPLLVLLVIAVLLSACSNPKDTPLPTSFDKMESIKPQLDKLTSEERELFAKYYLRHTVGAAMGGLFGVKEDPIPEGMTIGKAIDEQRDYAAKAKIKEDEAKALQEKVAAERKAKQEEFAKLITVAVVNKKNVMQEYGRRFVALDVAFENKSDKDIAGVKGVLKITDMFDDKIVNLRWSNDKGVKAKQTMVERGSGMDINQFMDEHMKLWNADFEKLKSTFEVSTIVFKDGTKIDSPE